MLRGRWQSHSCLGQRVGVRRDLCPHAFLRCRRCSAASKPGAMLICSRPSSLPSKPRASRCYLADGVSREPAHGWAAADGSPKIGKSPSPGPRPGRSSLQSACACARPQDIAGIEKPPNQGRGAVAVPQPLNQPAPEIPEGHRLLQNLERVAVFAQGLKMIAETEQRLRLHHGFP